MNLPVAVGESGGQMESEDQEKDEKKAVAKIVAGDKDKSNSEIAEKTGMKKSKLSKNHIRKRLQSQNLGLLLRLKVVTLVTFVERY